MQPSQGWAVEGRVHAGPEDDRGRDDAMGLGGSFGRPIGGLMMNGRPTALSWLLLGLVLLACHGPEAGVPTNPPEKARDGAVDELHALRDALRAELAEVEASLAHGADDRLLDRRLLLTVALSEIERRLVRPGVGPLARAELLRLAEQRLAAAKEAETERPARRVFLLNELTIEARDDDYDRAPDEEGTLGGLGKRSDQAVRQAAVVQDGGSTVPPEVQRALADQMGRVAPCLPPNESVRVTVRAQWFGEQLRGIALASEPPLVPAVSACLVDVLEAMRLPSSEGAMRVLVFPLAAR
jgi:hypothetical protein